MKHGGWKQENMTFDHANMKMSFLSSQTFSSFLFLVILCFFFNCWYILFDISLCLYWFLPYWHLYDHFFLKSLVFLAETVFKSSCNCSLKNFNGEFIKTFVRKYMVYVISMLVCIDSLLIELNWKTIETCILSILFWNDDSYTNLS